MTQHIKPWEPVSVSYGSPSGFPTWFDPWRPSDYIGVALWSDIAPSHVTLANGQTIIVRKKT